MIVPPRQVRMLLQIHWFDMNFATESLATHNISLLGQWDFKEVTTSEMEQVNRTGGGSVDLEPDLSGVAPNHGSKKYALTDGHPHYFDVVDPQLVWRLQDSQWSYTARILPDVGYTESDIRRWFDWENPEDVRLAALSARKNKKYQEIGYGE